MENKQNKTPKFVEYFMKKMNDSKTEEKVEVEASKTPMTGYSRTKVLASKPKDFER